MPAILKPIPVSPPPVVAWLEYGSVAPLLAYGAGILSFVGGLHWGFAVLLAPVPVASILVLGFRAQYRMDRRLTRDATLPFWYLPLRLRLTTVACCSVARAALSA